jgi:hypothetical protein
VLDRNRIKALDASSLSGLGALRELRLEGNSLRRLCHLSHLASLRCLHLGGNRIGDCEELDRLADATALVDLSLCGCPLARKPGYRTAALVRLGQLQVRARPLPMYACTPCISAARSSGRRANGAGARPGRPCMRARRAQHGVTRSRVQVLDDVEVTSEDRAAAFIAHAAAEAAAEAPALGLTRSPLRVASLHFVEGVQGAVCSGKAIANARRPGHLSHHRPDASPDRFGLVGVSVQERFRRAKRR